jgi:hypothetical protein
MDGLKIKGTFQQEANGGQLKKACQSPHPAKFQGMKNISNPRRPIEIYTFSEMISADDFRKHSFTDLSH